MLRGCYHPCLLTFETRIFFYSLFCRGVGGGPVHILRKLLIYPRSLTSSQCVLLPCTRSLCAPVYLVPSLLNQLLPLMSYMFSSFIYPCVCLPLRIRACVYLRVFLTLCFLYFMCSFANGPYVLLPIMFVSL